MATYSSTKGRKLKVKTKLVKPKAPKKTAAPKATPVDPLDATVQATADMQYGGQEQALQGQRGVNAQMARNIPAWFADYQAALGQATAQTQQAYAAAGAMQQNTAASSSALDAQQRATMLQGMQADAATRGATVDPNIAAQGQQAAASRRQGLDQFAGLTANQGAAQTAFSANRQLVGAGQKLTALQGEAQRARNTETQAGDLARAKGQFAVATKSKLQDAQRQAELENAAFGLKTQTEQDRVTIAAQTAADRKAARAATSRNAAANRQISAGRASETARHNQATETIAASRAKGKGGLTPAQVAARQKAGQKTRSQIDTAAADAKTLRGTKVPVTTPDGKVEMKDNKPTQRTRKLAESEIRAQLRKKYKDRDIANAAMDLAINGYVSPVNQRRLKARHIPVPKEWLAKRPKAKPKLPSAATLTLGGPTISQTMPK
jgi:hypothetical protein